MNHYQLQKTRIFDLLEKIENRTQQTFGSMNADYEAYIWQQIDNNKPLSGIIEHLNKYIDILNR